jgi:hypothetical protein
MSKDNGGPAYPTIEANYHNENMRCEGMTLRDYFAVKAMNALIVNNEIAKRIVSKDMSGSQGYQAIAREAYNMADAMLLERAK